MHIKNIFKYAATAVIAVGLMAGAFSASAANISMTPSFQYVLVGNTFSVDITATGLPANTAGGALDISWTGDLTLDSIWLATTDPADNGGGAYPGNWDPVADLLTGVDATGPTSISGLFVGSWLGVSGDQNIARLNFTLNAGPSASISMGAAALGGTWSSYDTFDFTNSYSGATVSAVPVPAALWLFGSGILGLAGVARRRRT